MSRLILLLLIMLPTAAFGDVLKSLEQLEWQNRIIVVKTASPADIVRTLRAAKAEIEDRHIAWFVLHQRRVNTNLDTAIAPELVTSLYENVLRNRSNETVLIGKDGGVKHRDDKLDLAYIYQLIDSMPMRQMEMQGVDY